MKIKRLMKRLLATAAALIVLTSAVVPDTAYAAVADFGNGIRFDPEFYSKAYPDAPAYTPGSDMTALLVHYLTVGILEGRAAYLGQDPQEIANLKAAIAAAKAGDQAPVAQSSPASATEIPAPAVEKHPHPQQKCLQLYLCP